MRKVREILRLKYECGRSHREIAASLQIAVGTVTGYLKRASAAGVGWADAQLLSDADVERRLFRDTAERNMPAARAPIDYAHVHSELRRKHVTLQLLWAEYQDTVAERGDEIIAKVPMRRMGVPTEIAEAVAWMCSDKASFMTGAAHVIDGGYSAA